MRDQINDERQKRESAQIEAHRSQQVLGDSIRSLETEIMTRIKEQREQQNQFLQSMDEERTRMGKIGLEHKDDNALAMRSVLSNIERKVEEEV